MEEKIVNSVVIIAMIFCITSISLELNNTNVLWWYIVPALMFLFSLVSYDDGSREYDEYGVDINE